MKVICSYCTSHICDKEPLEDERVSHGMCPSCDAYFERQAQGLSLSSYLDNFPLPIIAVDANGRMLAVNQRGARLMGNSKGQMEGQLGGDAMECCYA